MAYKHILIAVDLSPESKVLVEKAVSMARKMYRKAPDTFVVEVQEWIDARKG